MSKKPTKQEEVSGMEEAVETAEAYAEPTGSPRNLNVTRTQFITLVHRTEEERARLQKAREQAENDRRALEAQRAEVEQEAERLAELEAAALEREQRQLTDLKAQIDRMGDLAEAVQELRKGTTERLASEAEGAIAALEAISADANGKAESILTHARERADAVRQAADRDAQRRLEEVNARMQARQSELDEERESLERDLAVVEGRERQLRRRESRHRSLEDQLRAEVESQVREEVEALTRRLRNAEIQVEAVRDERSRLEAEVESLRGSARRVGERTQEDLLAEIDQLTRRVADAEADRDERPPLSVVSELQIARERAQSAENDANVVRARLAEAQAGAAEHRRLSAAVVELEQEREEHEQRVTRMQRRISDLRAELELLGDANDAEPPDKELLDIDQASGRRTSDEVRWRRADLDLSRLLHESQARMAAAGRFYTTGDVRVFLAGLAASHLHILEGISGTGKTSLPLAFTEAVGGYSSVVEVQAAWRDRLDLMGSYNAFDRRYYPTDFARALYRAATPGWSDTICLVVLDEMNLAHPEHYFADVLSAMESGKSMVEALPRGIGEAQTLVERRSIPISNNVWFIGTANRDETTSTIADKTYDRANVMELPERYTPFEVGNPGDDDGAIGAARLEKLFSQAEAKHAHAAEDLLSVVASSDLRRATTSLRIGFGNRLDRLVKRFVPVILESGGTQQEALDHVLATKLIRKLESRFDAKSEQLDALAEALSAAAGVEVDELPRTAQELARQRERLAT